MRTPARQQQQRRRNRRPLLLAIVVTAAAVVGVVGMKASHWLNRTPVSLTRPPTTGPVIPTSTTATNATVGPTEPRDDGPVNAAVRYVASLPLLARSSPVGRRELLRRMTTPEAFTVQTRQLQESLDRMGTTLGVPVAGLRWVEAPITATTTSTTNDGRTTVDVWSVAAVGGGQVNPQQMWRTLHVTLVNLDGHWRVDAVSSTEGPTPTASAARQPGSPADFDRAASWQPVVTGERL